MPEEEEKEVTMKLPLLFLTLPLARSMSPRYFLTEELLLEGLLLGSKLLFFQPKAPLVAVLSPLLLDLRLRRLLPRPAPSRRPLQEWLPAAEKARRRGLL